jgi:RimJ/RimL family protein N-acetyltransferase
VGRRPGRAGGAGPRRPLIPPGAVALLAPSSGGLPQLETERLVLRRWREDDLEPFAELNGDPETMAHFVAPLTRAESDRVAFRFDGAFDRGGLGMWAVESRDTARFVGSVGLLAVDGSWPFGPTVETGWRLRREYWGAGYATEAARAALDYGFEVAGTPEIVAFTAATNSRSQAVMTRLGMVRDPADDFLHPRIAAEHRLQPHVLYRLRADDRPRHPPARP